ncbi:phosphate signaling complex PhoU family protein [Aeropyrum camini]|uniref:Phosphate transport system protein PhoU n=1 Tax=Aeropyrum camini SY1 = JCM 12091 TaxID=1198449 RepID=U3TC34_9CREN|nr:phosphate uptake regulator PhoU [Aeropyrum camini]BAN89508.1 phosphate transport system protein PhoU [Aeropyrum camini SY1 = JCM 12091]
MSVDPARRDLEAIYSNLDRMYNVVAKVVADTLKSLSEWRVNESLDDHLYLAENLSAVVEEQATFFIAKYQPLGPELLEAKSLIRTSYDLYRIARYCREINRVIAYTSRGGRVLKPSQQVERAAEIVASMVGDAYKAFRTRDSSLRMKVEETDNMMDNIYDSMLEKIGKVESLSQTEAVDLLVIRHLERIADHAVYIARQAELR